MKRFAVVLGLVALFASSPASAIKVPTGSDDINFNINVLLQPRLEVTFDNTSPDKSADFDFFLRRARFQASATAYKVFTFLIQFDNSNYGTKGNLGHNNGNGSPLLIQDLIVGFTPFEDFTIMTGFLTQPGLRIGSYSASGGQVILEAPLNLILDNNSVGFRQNGVQLFGFLLGKRIHYRLGAFEGVHNTAGAAITPAGAPAANPGGKPMIGGHVRLNILGEETGYAYNQMYMDGKTRASVGVTAQYQKGGACVVAIGVATNTTTCNLSAAIGAGGTVVEDYHMYAADAFLDAALGADFEAFFDAGVYRWDYGRNNLPTGAAAGTFTFNTATQRTGWGYGGSAGVRFGAIAPWIHGYQYTADDTQGGPTGANLVPRATDRRKLAAGLTWFLKGHSAKLTAEVNSIINGDLHGPATNQLVFQTQAAW
jgi:hypothetical protein